MPRKSLLLLLPISFFLIVAPLARGDSINDLIPLDSGQPFTLYGFDYSGTFVLTPNSIVHLFNHELGFAASSPVGWAGGTVTFTLSYDDQSISGQFPNISPCSQPNVPCFGLEIVHPLNLSPKSPATLTFSYLGPTGGSETANFFVSNATPEPPTLLLFGTGGLLLGVIYRYRMRSAGRIL